MSKDSFLVKYMAFFRMSYFNFLALAVIIITFIYLFNFICIKAFQLGTSEAVFVQLNSLFAILLLIFTFFSILLFSLVNMLISKEISKVADKMKKIIRYSSR